MYVEFPHTYMYTIIHTHRASKSSLFQLSTSAAAAAKSPDSCPTLCDPMDCSPPGSSIHRNFPGKNIGVGCHFLVQGIIPNPETEPTTHALAGRFFTTAPHGKP